MFVKFHSSTAPDVMMQRNLAQFLLGLVGKNFQTVGVLRQEDLPAAIARLEAVIREEKEDRERRPHSARAAHGYLEETPCGLAQRAWPFLEMMRSTRAEGGNIVWGI